MSSPVRVALVGTWHCRVRDRQTTKNRCFHRRNRALLLAVLSLPTKVVTKQEWFSYTDNDSRCFAAGGDFGGHSGAVSLRKTGNWRDCRDMALPCPRSPDSKKPMFPSAKPCALLAVLTSPVKDESKQERFSYTDNDSRCFAAGGDFGGHSGAVSLRKTGNWRDCRDTALPCPRRNRGGGFGAKIAAEGAVSPPEFARFAPTLILP